MGTSLTVRIPKRCIKMYETYMRKNGNSYMILVPSEALDLFPFVERELLVMAVSRDSVIIRRKI